MTARPNAGMMQELYAHKATFPLDEDILEGIGRSTLSVETLQFVGMLVLWKQPRHIFEFGSGLTTLFLSRLQHRLGTTTRPVLTSIDHSRRYIGETRRTIGPDPDISLLHAPLAVTEYAGRVFTTYHPAYMRELVPDTRFDFVLIGGPPAFRYGREAPLYHLEPRLAPGAIILLCDANGKPEQDALRHWQTAWPGKFVVELFPDLQGGLAVLSLRNPVSLTPPPEKDIQRVTELERVTAFLKAEGGVIADGC